MPMQNEEIRRKAENLVKKYKFNSPPVDVEVIAEGEGVDVVFVKFKENSEKIHGFYDHQESRIYVNSEDSLPEKMYTIAHELGHHVLHQEYSASAQYVARAFKTSHSDEEKEADAFASRLLVPSFILEEYSTILKPDEFAHFFIVPDYVIKEIEQVDRSRTFESA